MKKDKKPVPKTVGLIMDGNGRWAEQLNKPRLEGHTKGIYNMISLVAHAFDCGVKNMVCYGLSTENLDRPKEEVEHIYKLMIDVFEFFVTTFSKIEASVKYIGNISVLPKAVQDSMKRSEQALSKFETSGKVIYIGVAYGSRYEIVDAANKAIKRGQPVTEESFLSMLDMPLQPELIIRTGGERRLSNFLLFQSSYSELYFSDKLFPDFENGDMDKAFEWFGKRERKFGLVQPKK